MKLVYRNSLNAILLVVVAGCSVKSLADTNYYRWLDSNGNPIHSDRPPPAGTEYEVVSTKSTLTRAVSAEEGAVPPDVEPSVGNEFTPKDSTEAQRSKKNTELCQRARTNLEALSASDTVTIRNSQGEVDELDPQEMQIQRETTKAQIKVYCGE